MSALGRGSFVKTITLTASDCDNNKILTPRSALLYVQEIACDALDRIGLTHEVLTQKYGRCFIVASHAARFLRPLREGETFTLRTAPMGARGPHFFRQVMWYDEGGSLVLEVQSDWILLDLASQKPMRATAIPEPLDIADGWEPFCDPSKLRIPLCGDPSGEYTVTERDIDQNNHLNNTVYADLMTSCHAGGAIKEFFIRYHRQARLGETITLSGGQDGDRMLSAGRVNDEACFAASFCHFAN